MPFSARLGVALLAFASPLLLVADGVVTSNSCTLIDQPLSGAMTTLSQTGALGCTITSIDPATGDQGHASASTSVTLHLPISGQPAMPVGASISAAVSTNSFSGFGGTAEHGSADASVTIDYLFSTSGPVRSGLIQLNQSSVSSVSFIQGANGPSAQ